MADYDTAFVEPGTLVRPGWIGRLVRLALGFLTLKLFADLLRFEVLMDRGDTGLTSSQVPDQLFFWLLMAFFFWILPHVVNIGFGTSWRRGPQVVVGGVSAAVAAFGLVVHGSAWTEALGWVLLVWLLYESLHLGASFVLAAALATPGCEMRALPELWSRVRGRASAEHYCPGFLDGLDRWERSRAKTSD